MNYNKVIIAGNVTRDPELKYLPNGNAVVNFTIAINRKWKTEQGEEREEVAFVGCNAFGKTAEAIGKYVRKGSAILCEGRLRQDTWEDKTTKEKKSKTYVGVDHWQFCGPKQDGDDKPRAAAPAPTPAPAPVAAPTPEAGGAPEPEDDPLPF